MNVALWVAAGLLAAVFVAAGLMKMIQPKEKLQESLAWTETYSQPMIRLIATFELLGAAGLILPAALGIAPVVVPIAAVGLSLLMVGALVTHLRRGEPQLAVMNIVLLALAVFVAWGRFGAYAF